MLYLLPLTHHTKPAEEEQAHHTLGPHVEHTRLAASLEPGQVGRCLAAVAHRAPESQTKVRCKTIPDSTGSVSHELMRRISHSTSFPVNQPLVLEETALGTGTR